MRSFRANRRFSMLKAKLEERDKKKAKSKTTGTLRDIVPDDVDLEKLEIEAAKAVEDELYFD